MTSIEQLANSLATRMREIDVDIKGDPQVVADGADYNLLWDAILEEFAAVGIDPFPLTDEIYQSGIPRVVAPR